MAQHLNTKFFLFVRSPNASECKMDFQLNCKQIVVKLPHLVRDSNVTANFLFSSWLGHMVGGQQKHACSSAFSCRPRFRFWICSIYFCIQVKVEQITKIKFWTAAIFQADLRSIRRTMSTIFLLPELINRLRAYLQSNILSNVDKKRINRTQKYFNWNEMLLPGPAIYFLVIEIIPLFPSTWLNLLFNFSSRMFCFTPKPKRNRLPAWYGSHRDGLFKWALIQTMSVIACNTAYY